VSRPVPALTYVLARALGYPVTGDQDGDALRSGSGELAISAPQPTGQGLTQDHSPVPGPGRCRPFTGRPRARRTWTLAF